MRWETELRAGQQQLSHLQSESQRLVVELKEERGKTERLQGLLHEATSHQITLQHQKDALQEKVDQVSCHHGNQLKVNIILFIGGTCVCLILPYFVTTIIILLQVLLFELSKLSMKLASP